MWEQMPIKITEKCTHSVCAINNRSIYLYITVNCLQTCCVHSHCLYCVPLCPPEITDDLKRHWGCFFHSVISEGGTVFWFQESASFREKGSMFRRKKNEGKSIMFSHHHLYYYYFYFTKVNPKICNELTQNVVLGTSVSNSCTQLLFFFFFDLLASLFFFRDALSQAFPSLLKETLG